MLERVDSHGGYGRCCLVVLGLEIDLLLLSQIKNMRSLEQDK